ncbi:hypothetical protein E2320_012692 [Naja naja]|nr:hypothetical protein E2320_012692 [Naja naja]
MEHDDVRFFVMKAVAENLGTVMPKAKQAPFPTYQKNAFTLISSIIMPSEEREIKISSESWEYPDFYTKLYSLLDPSIFHVKYRARFFRGILPAWYSSTGPMVQQIFDRDIKKESKDVPLEYQQPRGLFGKKDDLCAEYFSLE